MDVLGALRACALAPSNQSGLHPVHAAAPPLAHALPGRNYPASPIACPPFDSAASDIVQPVPELRHVQRHGHERHVHGALHACPDPQPSVRLTPACRCRLRRRWPTQALPRFTRAALAPHCMPALLSTRQQAYAFNQPLSLDTSSVTDMSQMFFVRPAYTALRPGYGPTPQAPVRPSPACYLRRHRPTRPPCLLAHTRPTHASPRIAYPPSDPAGSGCVQPAAELRRFQHHR